MPSRASFRGPGEEKHPVSGPKASHLLASAWGRRLMLVALCCSLASTMSSFVLPYEVVERTGNLGWAASAVGLSFFGQVIFSVPLGSWAERHSYRRSLQFLLLAALLPVLLSLLVLLLTREHIYLWALLLCQALLSLLAATTVSTAAGLARQQDEGRAISSVAALVNARQVSWFAGQAAGAWIVALAGADIVPVVAGLLIAVAIAASTGLPLAERVGRREPLRRKLARMAAFRQIWVITALSSSWNIAAGALTASLVPLLISRGVESGQIGLVYIAGAAGSVLAGVALHRLTRTRPERYLPALFTIWSFVVLLFWLSNSELALVVCAWALVMLVDTSLAGLLAGLRSTSVPPQLMVSASQATQIAGMICFALGGILSGLAADQLGIGSVLVLAATWTALLVLPAAMLTRYLRRVRPVEYQPGQETDDQALGNS